MADEKYYGNGNVRLRVYPPNGFTNFRWPTVAEMNAGQRLEDVVPWENFDFGVQASDTSANPPLSAKAVVDSRSMNNYGGNISFWYPGYYDDPSNDLSNVYDFFAPGEYERPACIIALSVDGEIGEPGQPAADFSFANGDYVSLFRVRADAWDDMTEGDDPFYYTLNFIRNGGLAHYTVVSTAAPVVAVTLATAGAVGTPVKATATVNGRDYSHGVRWSTSDPAVATVSNAGVVSYLTAGSATITATLPNIAGVSDSETVTVS